MNAASDVDQLLLAGTGGGGFARSDEHIHFSAEAELREHPKAHEPALLYSSEFGSGKDAVHRQSSPRAKCLIALEKNYSAAAERRQGHPFDEGRCAAPLAIVFQQHWRSI